jgi:hypothetical protein
MIASSLHVKSSDLQRTLCTIALVGFMLTGSPLVTPAPAADLHPRAADAATPPSVSSAATPEVDPPAAFDAAKSGPLRRNLERLAKALRRLTWLKRAQEVAAGIEELLLIADTANYAKEQRLKVEVLERKVQALEADLAAKSSLDVLRHAEREALRLLRLEIARLQSRSGQPPYRTCSEPGTHRTFDGTCRDRSRLNLPTSR